MRNRDNAPVAYTCPDIDSIISVLAGVSDRIDEIADQLDCSAMKDVVGDLNAQAANLRDIYEGRRSLLEELRSSNDHLRQWGNKECERADEAEAEISRLRDEISDLERQ